MIKIFNNFAITKQITICNNDGDVVFNHSFLEVFIIIKSGNTNLRLNSVVNYLSHELVYSLNQ